MIIKGQKIIKFSWVTIFVISLVVFSIFFWHKAYTGSWFSSCSEMEKELQIPDKLQDAEVELVFEKNIKNVYVYEGRGYADFDSKCVPFLASIPRYITWYSVKEHDKDAIESTMPAGTTLSIEKIYIHKRFSSMVNMDSSTDPSIRVILKDSNGKLYMHFDYTSDLIRLHLKDGSVIPGDYKYFENTFFKKDAEALK